MILPLRFIFKPFIIYVGYSQNIHTWVLPENLDWFPLISRTITTIIPDSSTRLKYKTASLLSHVLKSWLECLLHENDEVKILQRDPLEWLECNFIRPSVPSLSLSVTSSSFLRLSHDSVISSNDFCIRANFGHHGRKAADAINWLCYTATFLLARIICSWQCCR